MQDPSLQSHFAFRYMKINIQGSRVDLIPGLWHLRKRPSLDMRVPPSRLSSGDSLSHAEDVMSVQSHLQRPQDSPSLVHFSSLQMQLEKRLLPSKMRVLLENVVSVLGQKPAHSTIHMPVVLSISCKSTIRDLTFWRLLFWFVCCITRFMIIARHTQKQNMYDHLAPVHSY